MLAGRAAGGLFAGGVGVWIFSLRLVFWFAVRGICDVSAGCIKKESERPYFVPVLSKTVGTGANKRFLVVTECCRCGVGGSPLWPAATLHVQIYYNDTTLARKQTIKFKTTRTT